MIVRDNVWYVIGLDDIGRFKIVVGMMAMFCSAAVNMIVA